MAYVASSQQPIGEADLAERAASRADPMGIDSRASGVWLLRSADMLVIAYLTGKIEA